LTLLSILPISLSTTVKPCPTAPLNSSNSLPTLPTSFLQAPSLNSLSSISPSLLPSSALLSRSLSSLNILLSASLSSLARRISSAMVPWREARDASNARTRSSRERIRVTFQASSFSNRLASPVREAARSMVEPEADMIVEPEPEEVGVGGIEISEEVDDLATRVWA
jgi:hypothetical protein